MPGKVIYLDTYRRRRKISFPEPNNNKLNREKFRAKKLSTAKISNHQFRQEETIGTETLFLRLLAASILLILPAALIFQGMLTAYSGH